MENISTLKGTNTYPFFPCFYVIHFTQIFLTNNTKFHTFLAKNAKFHIFFHANNITENEVLFTFSKLITQQDLNNSKYLPHDIIRRHFWCSDPPFLRRISEPNLNPIFCKHKFKMILLKMRRYAIHNNCRVVTTPQEIYYKFLGPSASL